jgi:fructose-bisphosphate aldolase, class II
MFASTKVMLEKARRGKYAIGHFNINNMEVCQGVVQAAVNLKSPIIIATTGGAVQYAGINFLYEIAKTAAQLTNIPIALHFDHGRNIDTIKQAIRLDYSSVMFDGSNLKFSENIRKTRQLVNFAHKRGVHVEAELGTIGGSEDLVSARKIIYTNPEEAHEFVEKTGCDFLAVAIGTSHGAYKFKGKASLRQDILQEISKKVKIPLVLHGASRVPENIVEQAERYGAKLSGVYGVPISQIKKSITNGITKFNTDTDLRIAFDAGTRKFLKRHPKDFDTRHILGPARDNVRKVAEQSIKIFGSAGKG